MLLVSRSVCVHTHHGVLGGRGGTRKKHVRGPNFVDCESIWVLQELLSRSHACLPIGRAIARLLAKCSMIFLKLSYYHFIATVATYKTNQYLQSLGGWKR